MRPLETLLRRKLSRYVKHSAKTETKLLESKMCSAISTTPLLAKRCESSLPNEADSDVTFLVGPDGCRVPGHRAVLAAANPVFRCMLEGPLACGHSVTVPDVPWRGFANLLRYLYQEPVQLPTVQTTLATLYAAHKYQCHGLQVLCTKHLADSLDTSCVLEVFSNVRVYCDSFSCITKAVPEGDEWAPSAPPSDGDEQVPLTAGAAEEGLEAAVAGYSALRRRCLQFCDERADDVLSLEQLEELSRDELLELVSRDSFAPSSEALVFAAVARWARCRCLCSQRPLCADDLRDEAGDALLYAVRYPFMSLQDFVDGPMRSGLVSGEDAVFFLDRINRPGAPPAGPPPKHLEPHLDRMCTPRVGGGGGRRKSASPAGRHAGAAAAGCLHRKKTAKKDKKHKGSKDADADGFSFYFLSCLSCILD